MKMWLLALCICIGILGASQYEQTYKLKNCTVAESNECGALIADQNGHLWETKNDNLQEGEIVTLIMSNNHTKTIKDDVIIDIK